MNLLTRKVLLRMMVLATVAGCSTTIGEFGPNTHFPYPNSNVEPLGHVSTEVSRTRWFSNFVDQQMLDEALTKAVKQKGADALVDYKLSVTTTIFPLLPISTTTLRIDGTAVKMTVGKQELR